MAVQFHNAPTVSSIARSSTISSGQSSSDRQSASEYYSRPQTQLGTDSLQMGNDTAKKLTAAVKNGNPTVRQPWQPNPMVGGIVALAGALALVYQVGGIQLAIIMSMTLLVGLLLYGLGIDMTFKSWTKSKSSRRGPAVTTPLHRGPRLRVTGPLA